MADRERIPRYLEVASAPAAEIDGLAPNVILPIEERLAAFHKVSRVTIRGALDLLEQGGRISRQRGRGTIVNPPKVVRRFAPIYGFEQDLASHGIGFNTHILSYEPKATPSASIRERLALPSGATAGCLKLVRSVHGRVVCCECGHYPPQVAAGSDATRAIAETAAEIVENLVEAPIADVDWEGEIASASDDVADALGVSHRTLVLANSYTWRLKNGVPVEAGVVCYRVDRCMFRCELSFGHAQVKSTSGARAGKGLT
jgi:GntR family transcriptional regulator